MNFLNRAVVIAQLYQRTSKLEPFDLRHVDEPFLLLKKI